MRRTNADATTTPDSLSLSKLHYIGIAFRFFGRAAVHSGRTRNVAHVGRARSRWGDHLDLYRECIGLFSRRQFLSIVCFVLPTHKVGIEVEFELNAH